MSFPFPFNIRFTNVRGGISNLSNNNGNFRSTRISHKIKELEYGISNSAPTLFALLETKRKPSKNIIKLPNHLKFIGETCAGLNSDAGIILYAHKKLESLNFKVIYPKHACFSRIKLDNVYLDNIIVYLPCDIKECTKVLNEIEIFIQNNNLLNYCLFGDFNIDFNSTNHPTKAKRLKRLLDKCNMFDLAEKLNYNHKATWHALRNNKLHYSKIDHFYCNFDGFNTIKFEYNSFSDHMHGTVSFKKAVIYTPLKWNSFLFRREDFSDLMKREAIAFLFKNSNPNKRLKDLAFYQDNPLIADIDFCYEHLDYKETSIFFDLLTHLKKIHDSFLSRHKLSNFHKTKEFDLKISELYESFELNPLISTKNQIKQIIMEQQEYFKILTCSQSEARFFRKLEFDGNYNSFTFKHIKRSSLNEIKIKVGNDTITAPQLLANKFAENYAKIVSPDNVSNSGLHDLLEEYELSLEEIFPKIKNLTNPCSTTDEFKQILKNMKNSTAPGISSQPKVLFEFLINLLPKFITKALNNIYNIENLDDSPFKFIKDRNIVFIPKRNCDLFLIEAYRAIALLETVYKILSKALNKKISSHLDKIVHNDQFGFMPQKTMANCSLNLTAVSNFATCRKEPCQIISLDFTRAFDKVFTKSIDEIISYIFPGKFAKSFINLTNKGRFRAAIKGYFSKFYKIKGGTSQGDAPSGTKFIILNHVFVSCLHSKKLKQIFYKIGNTSLSPSSFADDNVIITQLKTNRDVHELKHLLDKLKNNIGLEINYSKTKILIHGYYPPELESLGRIESCFKHLGIYISFNQNMACQRTYQELINKMEKKLSTVPFRTGYNLIKRRNLCSAIMSSCAYHIYRIYPPDTETVKKITNITSKFLWSIKKADGSLYFRHKVARKRVELNIEDGGLNFLLPENQSFSIWLNSFMTVLKHAAKYPRSTLGIILAHKHCPINSIIPTFSFQTLVKNIRIFKSLYPCKGGNYFHKATEYFYNLEHDDLTFFYSPVLTSSFSNLSKPFTKKDEKFLCKNNKLTFASILETRSIGKHILLLPLVNSDFLKIIVDPLLVEKMYSLVNSFNSIFPKTSCFTMKKYKQLLIPLSTLSQKNKTIFSFHFKRLNKAKQYTVHPSISTRRRDGLYFPDVEIFNKSFKLILSLPIFVHYKNFLLEQFIRTLPSKNKLYKFKIVESNLCKVCNMSSNTEHAIFDCIFPKYFIHMLARFMDKKFNNNYPEFIFLKENFYLFNIYYEVLSRDDYLQLSQLILIAKERSLKISNDDCIIRWNKDNFYAQTLLLTQFTFKLLTNAGHETLLISEFKDFVLNNN